MEHEHLFPTNMLNGNVCMFKWMLLEDIPGIIEWIFIDYGTDLDRSLEEHNKRCKFFF